MPSLANQSPNNRRIDWPGIVRTLLVQVLVLLALAGAVAGYLNWSSNAAWTEFMAASKSAVPDAKQHPLFSAPVQPVKGHTTCWRKA
jgi:hypothetical protein